MILRDITPEHLRCGIGACPAVFESDRGTLIVIGRKADGEIVSAMTGRAGSDELIIEIPKELILLVAK